VLKSNFQNKIIIRQKDAKLEKKYYDIHKNTYPTLETPKEKGTRENK
jgi:hypothetical protein